MLELYTYSNKSNQESFNTTDIQMKRFPKRLKELKRFTN